MTHAEMNELYELYVLGALNLNEAAEIDQHVAEECEHCLANIHQAAQLTAQFCVITDPVTPPDEVRQRLLASLSRQPAAKVPGLVRARPRVFSWAVASFAAAACVVLCMLLLHSHAEVRTVADRLNQVTFERNQLRSALEMLARQDTRTIQFSQNGNPAHGRVLVNRDGGVVLIGSNLPAITEDKTYELWAIPGKGNPIPAGLFRADSAGGFIHVAPQRVNVSQLAAVAVSIEPRAGSAQPTTKPVLIVPVT